MRKPRQRKEKKNKFTLYAAIGIIVLMASSIIGLLGSGDGYETRTYGEQKLKLTEVGWQTDVNENTITFQYTPESVDDILLEQSDIATLLGGQMLYLTSNLSDEAKQDIAVAEYYLSEAMPLALGPYVQIGFTDHSTSAIPQVTCADATEFVPVIYFKHSNVTQVTKEGSCYIYESGYGADFLRLAERLVYEVVGISPEQLGE